MYALVYAWMLRMVIRYNRLNKHTCIYMNTCKNMHSTFAHVTTHAHTCSHVHLLHMPVMGVTVLFSKSSVQNTFGSADTSTAGVVRGRGKGRGRIMVRGGGIMVRGRGTCMVRGCGWSETRV